MKYKTVDFQITCSPQLAQIARDLLPDCMGAVGFESFEETPAGIRGYIPAHLLDADSLGQAISDFPLEGVTITYTLSETEDKNWNETWENKGFAPIDIDSKVVVYDARTTTDWRKDHRMDIGIEARQAFGTGTHETTQLMIRALLGTSVAQKRVLDCGCGTGILSIAASKLGAREVVGYDIDEWSVENTRHNAEINHIDNIEVFHGNAQVLTHVSGVFDVVMANINRNILLYDMETYVGMMSSGATLIISGFYNEDALLLQERANGLGLHQIQRETADNWCCLTFATR